jgi:hypothetical protein
MPFFRLSPTPPWREPTLKGLLSEPIITALMDADSVHPEELKAMLGWISIQLRSRSKSSDAFCADKQEACAAFTATGNRQTRTP